MTKTKNKEQEEYNKERIIDINLVLEYINTLDIKKEFFTEKGEGFLEALGSMKDELTFVEKGVYDESEKLKLDYYKKRLEIISENDILRRENTKLKQTIDYYKNNYKKRWFKNG